MTKQATPFTLALLLIGTLQIHTANAASASPQSAASLTVYVDCDPLGLADLYYCYASASGGTPPYSYAWVGTVTSAFGDEAVASSCPRSGSVRVTVTDAAGSSVSARDSFVCVNGF